VSGLNPRSAAQRPGALNPANGSRCDVDCGSEHDGAMSGWRRAAVYRAASGQLWCSTACG